MNILSADDSWMLPCMSKKMTGMDCPGCGIQRSISHIMKGELIDAFFMYPGIYPMFILFVFLTFDWFFKINHGEKIKLTLAVLTIGTILINYVIKLIF
ncbi:DUF2752 domain-containing protein [Nonlabens mediterrranea]|uniref:DUF2752 domain-containing protein n=2 Tax=Nonlabens mediterrranea TaxID=1419947 RepID=A0ABS0A9R0_9FLAO|nr:DUF2752 domain-containing protein [Nonlabens mediterrranea]